MNIIIAIVIFSLIILFHELGHFLLAKANHIRVNEFSLGLGPTLFGFTKGETKYCLKALPFGGSCVMDEDAEAEENDKKAFNNKNVWARLSVVLAGPVFNFIMAFILALIVILMMGYDVPVVNVVAEDTAAYDAGLQEGDHILEMNGKKVHLSREVSFETSVYSEKTIDLLIERDGKEKNIKIVPDASKSYKIGIYLSETGTSIESFTQDSPAEAAGLKEGDIIIGINGEDVSTGEEILNNIRNSKGNTLDFKVLRDDKELDFECKAEYTTTYSYGFITDNNENRTKSGFFKALQYSLYELKYWIKTTLVSLKLLVTGQVSFNSIQGPVGIVSVIGKTYNESRQDGIMYVVANMMNLAILLSANLGVMNLLPIPALDGGRILLFIAEIFTRKRLPQKVEGAINMIGFGLLMLLMVAVLAQDIIKLF